MINITLKLISPVNVLASQSITFLIFNNYVILEPAAGNGSFSNQIENCEAYDLYPEAKEIKKLNFLDYKSNLNKKYIVIGNPPFGKRSKDAISFLIRRQLLRIILL